MSDQNKYALELEQILAAIGYDAKITCKDVKDNQFTPYLLPLEYINDKFLTILKIGERAVHQRLAFSYEGKDGIAYYHFNGLDLKKADVPANDRFYLPLAKTEYRMQIGTNEDGKFTPHEGSPFRLLGIRGMKEPFPAAFITETRGDIFCRGLYPKNDVVTSFDFNSLDKLQLQHYLWRASHQKRKDNPKKTVEIDLSDPQAIIRFLQRSIVGQEVAMEMVAVAFSNYMV